MDTDLSTTHRLTEIELCRWLGMARPGERIIYHRGFLAQDCSVTSTMPASEREELRRLARRAMLLAEAGMVDLVQRRHGPDDYEYIVAARLRPSPHALRPRVTSRQPVTAKDGKVYELAGRMNDICHDTP
jgi:hypothetical protein